MEIGGQAEEDNWFAGLLPVPRSAKRPITNGDERAVKFELEQTCTKLKIFTKERKKG